MEEYLISTSSKLKSKDYAELNIVIGNESCDLDSAVCSLVYAMFLNWQYSQLKCKVCTRNRRDQNTYKDDIFVAILDVERGDYELKTEVAYCFKKHGIDKKHIVFRDDENIKDLVGSSKTNVTLVDHHVLSKKDQYLAPYVTEIIDHRPIDKSPWNYREDVRSTIELVGSCSTLVTKRIKDLSVLMSKDGEFLKSHPVCCELLYNTIILDTVNFSKEVNKATPLDVEMATYLETIMNLQNVDEVRNNKIEELVKARSDVSCLTPAQLLKKDVKIIGDVLVPSFPILVEDFLKKPGALPAVDGALSNRGCSLALLLGMDLSGGLRRDTAVYSTNDPDRAKQLGEFLKTWSLPSLQLAPRVNSSCTYFVQENLSASRKQYMPALNEFLTQ